MALSSQALELLGKLKSSSVLKRNITSAPDEDDLWYELDGKELEDEDYNPDWESHNAIQELENAGAIIFEIKEKGTYYERCIAQVVKGEDG